MVSGINKCETTVTVSGCSRNVEAFLKRLILHTAQIKAKRTNFGGTQWPVFFFKKKCFDIASSSRPCALRAFWFSTATLENTGMAGFDVKCHSPPILSQRGFTCVAWCGICGSCLGGRKEVGLCVVWYILPELFSPRW